MLVADFDYDLPKELIAQQPLARRDASRMLVLERKTGKLHDAMFSDIGQWLGKGDLLVLNNTRVIPARVFGKLGTGGTLELLLLRQLEPGVWAALARPSRKARPGTVVRFGGPNEVRSQNADTGMQNADSPQRSAEDRVPGSYTATIVEWKPEGTRVVRFEPPDISDLQRTLGEVALPPYIKEKCGDYGRYQTVFAEVDGAIAAPTAGLHFTPALIAALDGRGIKRVTLTLHVGAGTFRPIRVDDLSLHRMEPEPAVLGAEAVETIESVRASGGRVVAVGSTVLRTLETAAGPDGRLRSFHGETDLFIRPGYRFKVVDRLLTTFHLPRSTLFVLVAAFAGLERMRAAYAHAIGAGYRFYSYGDCCLLDRQDNS